MRPRTLLELFKLAPEIRGHPLLEPGITPARAASSKHQAPSAQPSYWAEATPIKVDIEYIESY